MQFVLLLLLIFIGPSLFADDLKSLYAPHGNLLITQFTNGPFPHPLREKGHTYKTESFDKASHYADSTVALFVPKGARSDEAVDLVVHFHGWRNNVEGVLRHYQLIEQLIESKRNVVLVVPQGPRDAPDSFGGKLEDPRGFARFIDETMDTLRRSGIFQTKNLRPGKIILSGHSGGYQVISSIVDRGGLPRAIREVWLFDALYAQTDKFLAWADSSHGRFVDIYTDHGGTAEETRKLLARLEERGTKVFAAQDTAGPEELRGSAMVFLHSDLPHDDVLNKRGEFRKLLETSCLGEIKLAQSANKK